MEPLSTVSGQPAAEPRAVEPARWMPPSWTLFVGPALVAVTLARLGVSANGIAWAIVQLVLVGIAAYDFANRRIKNVVTLPVSVLALVLRAAFERSVFVEVLMTGLIVLLAVFALALLLRGGLGMGDVKLAGMLGFLLGEKVILALFIGTVAGGIAAAYLLTRSTGRRTTMAYGPYLALGATLAILISAPPSLL